MKAGQRPRRLPPVRRQGSRRCHRGTPVGTTLSVVDWQSAMYAEGLPADVRLAALTKNGPAAVRVRSQRHRDHSTTGFDPDRFPQRQGARAAAARRRGRLRATHVASKGAASPALDSLVRPAPIEEYVDAHVGGLTFFSGIRLSFALPRPGNLSACQHPIAT